MPSDAEQEQEAERQADALLEIASADPATAATRALVYEIRALRWALYGALDGVDDRLIQLRTAIYDSR